MLPEAASHEALDTWALRDGPALALALAGTHTPADVERQRRWVDLAQRLALHSVWLPEMHFARGVCPAPLIELAAVAARTDALRIGTTSLLLPLHPPEAIAAELAALDHVSGGRLLVGLGRGFQRRMLEAFGVDPARKRDHFDESLDRIIAVWAEGRTAGGPLAPWQRPHPPLAVAAFGPKALAQAARRGLPYLASPVESLEQIAENQRLHHAGLPTPERRPPALIMRTVFVSNDADVLDQARRALDRETSRRASQMPAALQRATSSPLETRALVGTPEQVTKALDALCRTVALDLLIVRPQIGGIDPDELERSLVRLARDVWPAMRR